MTVLTRRHGRYNDQDICAMGTTCKPSTKDEDGQTSEEKSVTSPYRCRRQGAVPNPRLPTSPTSDVPHTDVSTCPGDSTSCIAAFSEKTKGRSKRRCWGEAPPPKGFFPARGRDCSTARSRSVSAFTDRVNVGVASGTAMACLHADECTVGDVSLVAVPDAERPQVCQIPQVSAQQARWDNLRCKNQLFG